MGKQLHETNTLDEFIMCLRQKHSNCYVPDFDANNAKENARVLFLFEKPGRMTDPKNKGSGFISQDNNDPTARATKDFLSKAGIDRKDAIFWNCISGWNGTRKITPEERKEAKDEINELLRILVNLESIVFVGNEAKRVAKSLNLEKYNVAFSLHPSPINRASRPEDWENIPAVWRSVKPNSENKFSDAKIDENSKPKVLKNIAIGLNVLLMLLCVGFFAGHGLPKSLMLWSSAILWFVVPIVNLLYIRKNS